MPLTSLSQTPLYQHLLSSLPSLRVQLQSAVTASMKQWLLEIRNVTGTVGKAAMEAMDARSRKWRSRREKDPMLRLSRVGSAVEMVAYERTDGESYYHVDSHELGILRYTVNVLDNDKIKVDFQPLYQCIHIYMSLDSLDDLRTSYQADRKARCPRFESYILLTHDAGPIGSYPPNTALPTLAPRPCRRDIRLLHYRVPCSRNHLWLPLRARSRRTMGCSSGPVVFDNKFCPGRGEGSRHIPKSQGMPGSICYDSRGNFQISLP
jgi:hypothetical protein